MTVQDQYTSTFVKAQETWAGVVESLTNNIKETFTNVDESLSDRPGRHDRPGL